ncbi:MAG: SRPBCC domain-containing protein [Pseudomonadota bacterium]
MTTTYLARTLVLLAALACSACASNLEAIDSSNRYPEKIAWPEDYQPAEAGFFVHNAIEIDAAPETVWEILVRAHDWPRWYEGASNVRLADGSEVLQQDSVFTWKTMGLNFESTVTEFVPYSRLSWESRKRVIRGYHGWLIVPRGDGCVVITEESQHGFFAFLQRVFQPNRLRKWHDVWLEELKALAEAPPAAARAN